MSTADPIIATWLVADTPEDNGIFPQVAGDSSSLSFQAVYWRCVVCFFATLARTATPARRVLFTNVASLPTIDGHNIETLLFQFGVEVRVVPITYRLRHPSIRTWTNQFYILDIIRDADVSLEFSSLIVLDADCVWAGSGQDLLADLARYGVLTLQLAHSPTELINGASRLDMKAVAELLTGRSLDHIPHYVGGEIFACTREWLPKVRRQADELWSLITRSGAEKPPLREEGHLLSVAYDLLGIPPGTADAHIKRLWTTFHYSNATDEDVASSRCLWHLPAEKQSGFAALYRAVVRSEAAFWRLPADDVRPYLARIMGVPRRTAGKFCADASRKIVQRLSQLRRRATPGIMP